LEDVLRSVGKSVARIESAEKVTGKARYVNDIYFPGLLSAVLVTSPHAHARILSVDTSKARDVSGVLAILTGEDFPYNLGLYLGDKPPLARDIVRHHHEPVAAVVAENEAAARKAAELIKVSYEPLEAVLNPKEALRPDAAILHEMLGSYRHISAVRPEPGTNVANRTKIRKGDIEKAFKEADVAVEVEVSFPPGDHGAMEPRGSIAEIRPDGSVVIISSTQAPFVVRSLLSIYFGIPAGKIAVIAPYIGGGFGGKAGIQLEGLAYLLSRAVGGRPVKLVNDREQDLTGSPGHIGLESTVKIAAMSDGRIIGMDLLYLFDSGAYADYAVNISRAAAISCTGPYKVDNVRCDSLCVYTNHPFASAYRGFGHIELATAVERAMDVLADRIGMDPVELRLKNAIKAGDTTPTGSLLDSNTGDLKACIRRTAEMIGWYSGNEERFERLSGEKVRAKGIACLWKAPAMPTNADGGAIITFNEDGSANVMVGAVEIGSGVMTAVTQIVAEKLKIDPDKIHVVTELDTRRHPHDWATAASRSTFMVGRAVIEACDDVINQIKLTASQVLHCMPQELEMEDGRVFIVGEPENGLDLSSVVLGYTYENGHAVGGQVIGRGRYISKRLTDIDPETGEGHPALEWTLGAQAVEVEINLLDGSLKVIKAASTIDVGRTINPLIARGQVAGAIQMALGFATTEGFSFNSRGQIINDSLRGYKLPRFGQDPEYLIDFVETPQRDGPYNMRGMGEQGIIAIPAALANAVSRAIGKPVNILPITAERIWQAMRGQER